MKLTTQKLPKKPYPSSTCWLVFDGQTTVGMIERFGPSKGEEHPWKMYLGIGDSIRDLGATFCDLKTALDLIGQNLQRLEDEDRDCRRMILNTERQLQRDSDPHRGTVPMPEDWGA